jgi:hypothetical protein
VCKANSPKIYDVGDTEYPLIAELVDTMPMEQLMEVEDASPVGSFGTAYRTLPDA